MINVTVLPITESNLKPGTPLVRIMTERLNGFAAELQVHFQNKFSDEKYGQELVVYISYNSNYTVRWKIVNDVSQYIQDEVTKRCADLGYIQWKGFELYSFRIYQQH
ncbi:MAG TPA: hypothetical protein VK541_01540 [Pedobacter sp.]|uniref:hypothetical protein n=1 Tax=Pedobacter sp. TaxID=1411316 RepID=UPI002C9E4125|nr:hypothetical protein [Pedobacter sp.]HMI01131.1 hypothetical protein [Pedobacter sp.]